MDDRAFRRLLGHGAFAILLLFAYGVDSSRSGNEAKKVALEQQCKDGDKYYDRKNSLAQRANDSTPIDSPSQENKKEIESEQAEFWPSLFGVRVKITDSLLVLFTYLLWLATRDLVNDASDASQRQLRAYVSVRGLSTVALKDKMIENRAAGVAIEGDFINSGQTPALRAAAFCLKATTGLADEIIDFCIADNETSVSGAVGPGVSFNSVGVFFDASELSAKMAQKSRIFVLTGVVYDDIFDRRYIEIACFELKLRNSPLLISDDPNQRPFSFAHTSQYRLKPMSGTKHNGFAAAIVNHWREEKKRRE